MNSGNIQNKKIAFEPKLLIFEGNDVAAQEKKNLHSQQIQQTIQQPFGGDFYQGMTVPDLMFMNGLPEFNLENHDKDCGIVFGNTNRNLFAAQQTVSNLELSSQQQGKKKTKNQNAKGGIKQSKSTSDVKKSKSSNIPHSASISNQLQNQSQPQLQQGSQTITKNDSAGSLTKLQNASNIQISNIKGNVKNTYIKKISSLMSEQNQSNGDLQNSGNEKSGGVKQEIKDSEDEGDEMSDSPSQLEIKQGNDPQENKRLQKNRESARNSRQRKKIYIDLLEKKVSEINKQIEEVCLYINKSQENISLLLEQNPFLRGLIQDRLGFIEKIQKQINDPNPNEEELNLVCDSFRLRLGATGRIRQYAINLFFKHLYKGYLEGNYQYFLYGFDQNQDDEDDEFNRCVEVFKDTVGLPENDNQIYNALPILKKFLDHRKQFKKTYREMKNIQKEWLAKTATVESLVDKISPLLTATQVGRLIDSIDKKRQQPELSSLKRKYLQVSVDSLSNNLIGQSSSIPNTASPFNAMGSNNYQQQLMTPTQILSASNALNSYQSNTALSVGSTAATTGASKNFQFQNSLDFQIDSLHQNNNLGIATDESAQNFYSSLQFTNYRMYQPTLQLPQSTYFQQQHNQAVDQNQHLYPSHNHHHSHHNPAHHLSLMNDQILSGAHQSGQNIPFFDLLPHNVHKEDQHLIKSSSGIMLNPNDHYLHQEPAMKKRKQF